MAKTLLLVEDLPENREVLAQILSRAGFNILEAADGQGALAKAEALQPDLIVLDIGLPDLDGFEVLQRLLAKPETARIPVVFLTAHDDEERIRQAARLGATNFLVKPIAGPDLVEAIEDIFSDLAAEDLLDDEDEEALA